MSPPFVCFDSGPPQGFKIAASSIARGVSYCCLNRCYVTEYTVCSSNFKVWRPRNRRHLRLPSLLPARRRHAVGDEKLRQIDPVKAIFAIAKFTGDFSHPIRLR